MSENNTKKLSFYLVIIFIVAVTLILVSTLSQYHLTPDETLSEEDEQLAFNQTIQQSVSELIAENEKLSSELDAAHARIQELESAVVANEMATTEAQKISENEEFLKSAEENYEKGDLTVAKEAIMNVNAQILDGEKLEVYNRLAENLGI